jgi:hypothetical protein
MLAYKSKWDELRTALSATRKYSRVLEGRKIRDRQYGMLLFLLFLSLFGFLAWLIHRH